MPFILFPLTVFAKPTEFEERVQAAVATLLPSVVAVIVTGSAGPSFGAGFVVDQKAGLVLTNYHLFSSGAEAIVKFYKDEKGRSAEMVLYDPSLDVALLKVKTIADVPPALVLSREPVKTGQFIIAVGSPGGYDYSVSLGVVSAIDRKLGDLQSRISFLQVDAPMYKGSSGGPLANLEGEVVGLNSRGSANGVAAFSVPVRDLWEFTKRFSAVDKQTGPGYLGAQLQLLSKRLNLALGYDGVGGILISYVHPNSAAEKAGLRPGDIITRVDKIELSAESPEQIALMESYIMGLGSGTHELEYWRAGKRQSIGLQFEKNSPCKTSAVELDRISWLTQGSDRCYITPVGEFLEIKKAWFATAESGEDSLRAGDLVIEFDADSRDLGKRLRQHFDQADEKKGRALVLRNGRPLVVVVEGKKSG